MSATDSWQRVVSALALVGTAATGCATSDDDATDGDADADVDVDVDIDVDADGDSDRPDRCSETLPTDLHSALSMKALEDALDEDLVPGGAIAIVWGGSVRFVGVAGSKDWECKPLGVNTAFRLGVLTEPVTAAALLAAQSAKDIDIDAPLGDLVSELAEAPGHAREITARDALTHTSGYGGGIALDRCIGLKQWRDQVPQARVWSTPGRLYQYNPANYALAGVALMEATGLPSYEYAVYRLILQPAGLSTALFDADAAAVRNHTDGHGFWGIRVPIDRLDCGSERPAEGLIMGIRDYAGFVAMLQRGGDGLIGPADVGEILTASAPSFAPSHGTSLGLERVTSAGERTEILVRQGTGQGFAQAMLVVPDYDFAVVVLMNADWGRPELVAWQTARIVLGIGVQPVFIPDPVDLAGLDGTYLQVLPLQSSKPPFRAPQRANFRTLEMRSLWGVLAGRLDSGSWFALTPVRDVDVFLAPIDGALGEIRFWRGDDGQAFAIHGPTAASGPPFYRQR